MSQKSYTDRRDQRFFEATKAVLQDIHTRVAQLPLDERYPGAYGVLYGYVENLLVNFAEAFSAEQIAEIRIVLDQLQAATGEDSHLSEGERTHRAELAQALRDMKPEAEEQPLDWKAIEAQAQQDLEAIQTDKDAYTFIDKYMLKELRPQLRQIYRSDRHEMNRTPRQAIDNLLSLPPL